MEGATVAEGESPRFLHLQPGKEMEDNKMQSIYKQVCYLLVHGVQVDGRFLLGLASGQESDSRYGGWHSALKSGDGSDADLYRARPGGSALTRSHHVRLEEGAFQVDIVISQSLEKIMMYR